MFKNDTLSILVNERVNEMLLVNLYGESIMLSSYFWYLIVYESFFYVISLLTTRELAIGFWLVFILLYILLH